MKTKWWKTSQVNVIWTLIRIWLGIQWVTAGWGKITGGFEVNGFLQGAIAKAGGEAPIVQGWYAGFLENFALPNAGLFNVLVPWGELLIGIGLILGAATIPALIAAAFMNLNFLLAGTISTNPEYLALEVILLLSELAATTGVLTALPSQLSKLILLRKRIKRQGKKSL